MSFILLHSSAQGSFSPSYFSQHPSNTCFRRCMRTSSLTLLSMILPAVPVVKQSSTYSRAITAARSHLSFSLSKGSTGLSWFLCSCRYSFHLGLFYSISLNQGLMLFLAISQQKYQILSFISSTQKPQSLETSSFLYSQNSFQIPANSFLTSLSCTPLDIFCIFLAYNCSDKNMGSSYIISLNLLILFLASSILESQYLGNKLRLSDCRTACQKESDFISGRDIKEFSYFSLLIFWMFNQYVFCDNIRGDMLDNKMRLTFFELKIDENEKKGRELRKSQGKKAVARGRVLSMAYDKHSKTKTAPEDPERKRVGLINPQQYTQPRQPNRNINKIMFTLPEIKPIITQQQTQPQDLVSYHSTKLTTPVNNHKMIKNSKDFSSRYYRQIQILKEMREPSSSQKIFTITHLQNKELDGVGKNIQKKLGKKGMPSAALDKYQIVRDRQQIAIPSELLAKKFTSCAFEDENSGKNTTRFRFDSMVKLNKRSKSNLTPGGEQVFKLEGWGREDQGMEFYRYK